MSRRRNQALTWPVITILVIVVAVSLYREWRTRHPKESDEPGKTETGKRRKGERPKGGPPPAAGTPRDNGALGLPTAASASPDDYLITLPQYVESYNRDRGIPNWVAWHLDASDLGPIERGQFAPNTKLPKGWPVVTPNDYRNLGYDRGHMCPSGDRTATKDDNTATFLMTNVIPQAAQNNQGPWADFEDYCRSLARDGNELYIVCGGSGPFTSTSSSKLKAPTATWKVVVVLANGDNDASRVDDDTRVIALSIPNNNDAGNKKWQTYRTSVAQIAQATGFKFMPNVPDAVWATLAAHVDDE